MWRWGGFLKKPRDDQQADGEMEEYGDADGPQVGEPRIPAAEGDLLDRYRIGKRGSPRRAFARMFVSPPAPFQGGAKASEKLTFAFEENFETAEHLRRRGW